MAIVRGVYNTANYEAGIKKLDVRDRIFNLQPDVTPFLTIMSKVNKFRAVDTEFSWFEDDLLGNYTQLNMGGNAASTVTALTVDDATIFQEGDVIKCFGNSEECLLVTGITSTTVIDVTRGWGETSAGTINDNDYLYKLGSSQAEAYSSPESLVLQKVKKWNYLQTFSKTIEISDVAENVATYGGNRRNYERHKKAIELKREIESQFLWGEKKEDTTGAHPRRQTGGVYTFIDTNAPTLDMSSSAVTESAWEGWLKDVFLYSEVDRYFFCGPLIASQISQFALGKQRIESGRDIKYGVKINTYHSTMGDIHIVIDRHFIGPNAGKGLALEVGQMTYRYLQNMDFKLELNQQAKKDHYKLDEYSATIGLEIHHDKLHGIVKGVA